MSPSSADASLKSLCALGRVDWNAKPPRITSEQRLPRCSLYVHVDLALQQAASSSRLIFSPIIRADSDSQRLSFPAASLAASALSLRSASVICLNTSQLHCVRAVGRATSDSEACCASAAARSQMRSRRSGDHEPCRLPYPIPKVACSCSR